MHMCNRLHCKLQKANSTSASTDTPPSSMSLVVGGAVGGVAAAVAVTVVIVLAVLRKRRFDTGCISFTIQSLTYRCTIRTVVYFKYCPHVRVNPEWYNFVYNSITHIQVYNTYCCVLQILYTCTCIPRVEQTRPPSISFPNSCFGLLENIWLKIMLNNIDSF